MAAVKGRSVKVAGHHIFYFSFSQLFLYIFLVLLVVFTGLPLVYVAVTAFKPMNELFIFPPKFLTSNPVLDNFYSLFMNLDNASVPFSRYIFNSALTSVAVVLGTVIVSTMAAYGLVKLRPKGSNLIFSFILAALMFSTHVTQIPNYMVVEKMGMINTYWALILPKVATAFNMFLMKKEIMDGYCSWLFGILSKLEKALDISEYSDYDKRVFGFLAERLLDVYLVNNGLDYKEIDVMFMEQEHWVKKGLSFIKRIFIH